MRKSRVEYRMYQTRQERNFDYRKCPYTYRHSHMTLKKFIEVLNKPDINNGFHAIRNRDYYDPIPDNSQMDSEPVCYAGYTFNIPALITDLK